MARPLVVAPNRTMLLRMVLTVALLLVPMSALAASPSQDGTLDPLVVDAVQQSARGVAAAMGGGTVAPLAAEPAADVPVVEEPVVEEPVADEPVAEPRLAPEEITFGESAETESGVLSLLYPDSWEVTEDEFSGMAAFSDAASGFEAQLMDAGGAFPGLLIFPILEGNGQLMLDSMGANASLVSMTRSTTEDGLPALRIEYAGAENPDGEIVSGAVYFVPTGDSAFGIMAAVGSDYWPVYVPYVDDMVASILVDEEAVSLRTAGPDGERAEDVMGRFSIMVPAGWYYSPVQDAEMGLSVANPDVSVVGAMLSSEVEPGDEDLQILAEVMAGATDEAQLQELLAGVVEALELGSDESIVIDTEATKLFPPVGAELGTLRVVGEFTLEDGGPTLPLSLYLTFFPESLFATVFFGDLAAVEAEEEAILNMGASLEFAE